MTAVPARAASCSRPAIAYGPSPCIGARDHEDSWFGGVIDGEGSFSYRRRVGGTVLVVYQCDGPVLNRMLGHCIARRYVHSVSSGPASKLGSRPVHWITVSGMREVFRVMGLSRPVRFIGIRWWEGKRLPDNGWHTVAAIEQLGETDLVEIRTSTRTYVAEGFVAHDAAGFAAENVEMHDGRRRRVSHSAAPSRHVVGIHPDDGESS